MDTLEWQRIHENVLVEDHPRTTVRGHVISDKVRLGCEEHPNSWR